VSTIDGATYTVDSAGNRTSKTDNRANVTSNYGYDAIYELLQTTQGGTTTESYTYDPVGNRLSSLGVSTYSNNSSNELTSTPSASYTYDNNGNMTSKTDSTGTTNYTWDYENRLATVVLPGTGGSAAFKYDPFGCRIQKAFTQGSTTTTTNYAYDGDNSVEDVDQNGNLLARYTQTANIDEPLAEIRSGTTSYYEADGLGSVTSLTSSAGALANTYTYDSFGKLTASTGSVTNRFQYTAREFDAETSLYFYRARYYDPLTGRFASEDPIRFRGGVDFYTYVFNRPTMMRDPRGRYAWGLGLSGAGMLGAFWFGAGAEGSCLLVHDSAGNTGVLCCFGLGAGAVSGAGASFQGTAAVCPTCKTICDMEGGSVQGEAFGGVGVGVAGGGGVGLNMNQATIFSSYGPSAGAGGGAIVLGVSCKLVTGEKNCKGCPIKK